MSKPQNEVTRHAMCAVLFAILINLGLTLAVAQQPGQTLTVTGDNLRLRAQPSTSADILTTLSRGASATIMDPGEGMDWIAIRLPDGTMGWVHKDYVQYDQASDSVEHMEWFGDFAFAAVSRPEESLILHGHFDPGLPVKLIAPDGSGYATAKTGEQGFFEDDVLDDFAYTRVSGLENSSDYPGASFAIVGAAPDYTLQSLRPLQLDYIPYDDIAKAKNELREGQRYTDMPNVFRFGVREAAGTLFGFSAVIYHDDNFSIIERQYVVAMSNGQMFNIEVGCAGTPMIFLVGNEPFAFSDYKGCEHGARGSFVKRLTPERGVWSNFDYSM